MKKEFINTDQLCKPSGYSHVAVVEGGKTIFISGALSMTAEGEIIGKGDLRAQTEKAMDNFGIALKAAGATFDDVVKMNYFVVNIDKEGLGIVRDVRSKYLSQETPPSITSVGVKCLYDENLLIEIEGIAVIENNI